MSRKSSFVDNCSDSLKVLTILSLQSIRKFNKLEKDTLLKNDEESKQIRSFFERNGNTVTEMKWDAPTFD